MATQTQFIREIGTLIQKYIKIYEYPYASPIIAQACLESAYGTSELATNAHNYFGIKYTTSTRVPSASGYYYKVGSEQNSDGSYTSSTMKWCKFDSMEDCVKGYFEFLKNGYGRYDNLKSATSPKNYLELIRADGYATSLSYVNNNYKVITENNLTSYDIAKTTYYVVNCGSYSVYRNAVELQAELTHNYISAYIRKVDNLYKVRVGKYNNKSVAESKMKEIKAKGFDCFVTEYD